MSLCTHHSTFVSDIWTVSGDRPSSRWLFIIFHSRSKQTGNMRLTGFSNCVTEESAVSRGNRKSDLRCSALSSTLDAEVTEKNDIYAVDDEGTTLFGSFWIRIPSDEALYSSRTELWFKLLKPTGHVMHGQFNIQQLYVLPTLYLCVLYLSENKQRLVPLTA